VIPADLLIIKRRIRGRPLTLEVNVFQVDHAQLAKLYVMKAKRKEINN